MSLICLESHFLNFFSSFVIFPHLFMLCCVYENPEVVRVFVA